MGSLYYWYRALPGSRFCVYRSRQVGMARMGDMRTTEHIKQYVLPVSLPAASALLYKHHAPEGIASDTQN